MQPLEFCRSESVIPLLQQLASSTEFWREFARYVNEHNLNNMIGVSLQHRRFIFEGASEDSVFIENNDDTHESVVYLSDLSPSPLSIEFDIDGIPVYNDESVVPNTIPVQFSAKSGAITHGCFRMCCVRTGDGQHA